MLSELRLSLVSYIVSYLGLGLVLGIELVLDLGLGSFITDLILVVVALLKRDINKLVKIAQEVIKPIKL